MNLAIIQLQNWFLTQKEWNYLHQYLYVLFDTMPGKMLNLNQLLKLIKYSIN